MVSVNNFAYDSTFILHFRLGHRNRTIKEQTTVAAGETLYYIVIEGLKLTNGDEPVSFALVLNNSSHFMLAFCPFILDVRFSMRMISL